MQQKVSNDLSVFVLKLLSEVTTQPSLVATSIVTVDI